MVKHCILRQLIVTISCLFLLSPVNGQNPRELLYQYLYTVSGGDVSKWDEIKTYYATTKNYFNSGDFEQGHNTADKGEITYGKQYKVWPDKMKVELYSDSLFLKALSSFYFFKSKNVVVLGDMDPIENVTDGLQIDLYPVLIKNYMVDCRSISYNGMKFVLGIKSRMHEIEIETKQGEYFFFLISPETHLLDAIYYPKGRYYVALSNYQNIAGYLLPTRETSMREGTIFSWTHYKTISFNVPIDPKKFDY